MAKVRNIIELQKWIIEALEMKHGKASLLEVCKIVWAKHENELRLSGDLFYTWQYEIRWAGTGLRKKGL